MYKYLEFYPKKSLNKFWNLALFLYIYIYIFYFHNVWYLYIRMMCSYTLLVLMNQKIFNKLSKERNVSGHKWFMTHRVLKSRRYKMYQQCVTVCHMPKCMSCHKVIMCCELVMTTYIYYIYIYMYIYIYIYYICIICIFIYYLYIHIFKGPSVCQYLSHDHVLEYEVVIYHEVWTQKLWSGDRFKSLLGIFILPHLTANPLTSSPRLINLA